MSHTYINTQVQPLRLTRSRAPLCSFCSLRAAITQLLFRQVSFIGARGLDDTGILAIDDISVEGMDIEAMACTIYPTTAVPWSCSFEGGSGGVVS